MSRDDYLTKGAGSYGVGNLMTEHFTNIKFWTTWRLRLRAEYQFEHLTAMHVHRKMLIHHRFPYYYPMEGSAYGEFSKDRNTVHCGGSDHCGMVPSNRYRHINGESVISNVGRGVHIHRFVDTQLGTTKAVVAWILPIAFHLASWRYSTSIPSYVCVFVPTTRTSAEHTGHRRPPPHLHIWFPIIPTLVSSLIGAE
ncbi:hypothetical protein BD410DRAFT_393829 [Rickenella mellea]|uniref:Uncharacterized protein n=1 Tax=Rickenella mellea TaxID=50990 RepID=A0A4Y7PYF1_9AGAM|nr:hypothetical protein BD410DRAFT_393829 [Rickenella mellea]